MPGHRPPKWARKLKKFVNKKAKRAKEVFTGKKQEEPSWSFGSSSEEEDEWEDRVGFEAQVAGFRRLKSQRSSKWDPDILAAWGGNPVLFTNEDLLDNDIRAETIRDANHGRSFVVQPGPEEGEKQPLYMAGEGQRGYGGAEGRREEEAFYSPGSTGDIPIVRLRLVYFLICFATSISSPFFVLYMKNTIGMSAGEVGLVAALQIVGGYAVGPAFSLLVDRYKIHKSVWVTSILLGIVPVELITSTTSFESALAVALAIAALNAPISSLLDSSTLRFLGSESHEYGKIRLWGAVGWGLGSLVAGSIVQVLGDSAAFHLFGLCMVAVAVVVYSLDFTTLSGWDDAESDLSFGESASLLIPNAKYSIFLVVAVVAGFGATSLQSLLLMFLSDLGAPDILEGLTLSVATLSEMPIFYASGAIIKRYGASSLLLASMVVFTIRSVLVSFLQDPWMVLPLQLLHGFTFAGAWTAGVAIAKQNSPPGMETSGQSLFSLAYSGVGGLSGSIVGGQLYNVLGPRTMYRIKGLVFALTAVTYTLTLVDWEALRLKKWGNKRSGHFPQGSASAYHAI